MKRSPKLREYADHSKDPISDLEFFCITRQLGGTIRECSHEKALKNDRGLTFPLLLYVMLQEAAADESIFSWNANGRSFKVHDRAAFEAQVMPRFFQSSRFSTFQRQLNLYQFSRIRIGGDKGSFIHYFFLRGRPDLIGKVERLGRKEESPGEIDAQHVEKMPSCREMTNEEIAALCTPRAIRRFVSLPNNHPYRHSLQIRFPDFDGSVQPDIAEPAYKIPAFCPSAVAKKDTATAAAASASAPTAGGDLEPGRLFAFENSVRKEGYLFASGAFGSLFRIPAFETVRSTNQRPRQEPSSSSRYHPPDDDREQGKPSWGFKSEGYHSSESIVVPFGEALQRWPTRQSASRPRENRKQSQHLYNKMKFPLLVTSLLVISSEYTAVSQECCPCGSTDADCFITYTKGRLDVRVDGPYGTTCATMLTALSDFDYNPTGCRANVLDSVYTRCCADEEPDPDDYFWLAEVPTPAPGSDVGELACQADPSRCENDVCHLCWRTEEFPNRWATVTASLFIPGNPTCRDLYYLGLSGAIPNRICRPLQDYYEDPCGCPLEVSTGGEDTNGGDSGNGGGNTNNGGGNNNNNNNSGGGNTNGDSGNNNGGGNTNGGGGSNNNEEESSSEDDQGGIDSIFSSSRGYSEWTTSRTLVVTSWIACILWMVMD